MKDLMTGNEAIARGAWEAGVKFASAYPGTPSTEILENLATYEADIIAEWAPNEKVAFEAAMGAAFAGARSIASMKHVGVNVAADPLFTMAYIGVNGGMVLVTADEPGQHSSQNEQDNRYYAKFAKIPLLEPSDSQECKDMVKVAYDISEQWNTPVLLRMTTRVCHSKGIVELEDRKDVAIREYKKDIQRYLTIPSFARVMRVNVENRMNGLKTYSDETPLNFIEWHDKSIGVIASGVAYKYAREVFGDSVSYLKLGFTNPMPDAKIREFCSQVETIYVIEENDPIIEEHVMQLGFACKGKSVFPPYGEMTPDVIRKSLYGKTFDHLESPKDIQVPRPPALCAGCPHRGFFYELGKRKNVIVAGDIGCYTLAFADPYNAVDFNVCMGSSFSAGHGFQKVLNLDPDNKRRVVSVLGDSTFFHTGINSLLDVVYNQSNTVNVILDNRITGMTGHQENPGSGYTVQGDHTNSADIEMMVRACGIKNVVVINPNDLAAVKKSLDWALSLNEPSVIITRWPCVLKKFSQEDKEEFKPLFTEKCIVDPEKCIGCKICLKTGCFSLVYNKESNKVVIDRNQCVGCTLCMQVCPKDAISKEV